MYFSQTNPEIQNLANYNLLICNNIECLYPIEFVCI